MAQCIYLHISCHNKSIHFFFFDARGPHAWKMALRLINVRAVERLSEIKMSAWSCLRWFSWVRAWTQSQSERPGWVKRGCWPILNNVLLPFEIKFSRLKLLFNRLICTLSEFLLHNSCYFFSCQEPGKVKNLDLKSHQKTGISNYKKKKSQSYLKSSTIITKIPFNPDIF